MAHVQFLHDDLADPTLALEAGLTVQYVEVQNDETGPHEVVEVSGSEEALKQFIENYDLGEYRISG